MNQRCECHNLAVCSACGACLQGDQEIAVRAMSQWHRACAPKDIEAQIWSKPKPGEVRRWKPPA
jgi:hypothetical protein